MNDPAPDQLVFPFGMGDSSPDPIRVDLLGGKGASLAEMSRQAFPVPPGFTISTACCQWAITGPDTACIAFNDASFGDRPFSM